MGSLPRKRYSKARKPTRFCKGNNNPYASMTEILQKRNWETLAIKRKTTRLSCFVQSLSQPDQFFSSAWSKLQPNNDKTNKQKRPVGTTHLSLLFLER